MTKTPDDFVFFWKPDGPNGWAGQWYPSPFTVRVALPPPQGKGDAEATEKEERDVYFPTAEHWMMAQKALLFEDREIFERVVGLPSSSPSTSSSSASSAASASARSATGPGPTRSRRSRPSKATSPTSTATRRPPSPKEVKALGRKVKNFDDETWVRERTRIVLEGSLHKFRQNANLRKELFATGERELVEASPLDRIWGIGMGEKRGRETCASEAAGRQGWGLNLLGRALVQAREVLREEFKDEAEAEGKGADGGDGETE